MALPTVFISSSRKSLDVVNSLKHQLSNFANVVIWSDAFNPGLTPIESLLTALDRIDFAVVVLGKDDAHRGSSGRDNVVFELGLLIGKLGRARTFILTPDESGLHLPSDLSGIPFLRFAPEQRDSNLIASLAPAVNMIRNTIVHRQMFQEPIEYYSCFLSYSAKDQIFVERLNSDLQEAGVRCWLDSQEVRIGDSIVDTIDRGIQDQDRVLLVLSSASVSSSWVKHEVAKAFEIEVKRKQSILFPLRLDDSVFKSSEPLFSRLLSTKHIADFEDWNHDDKYRRAFSRLLRELTIAVAKDTSREVGV